MRKRLGLVVTALGTVLAITLPGNAWVVPGGGVLRATQTWDNYKCYYKYTSVIGRLPVSNKMVTVTNGSGTARKECVTFTGPTSYGGYYLTLTGRVPEGLVYWDCYKRMLIYGSPQDSGTEFSCWTRNHGDHFVLRLFTDGGGTDPDTTYNMVGTFVVHHILPTVPS